MWKVLWLLFFSLGLLTAYGDTLIQNDSLKIIKVHFLYGSKPKKEFRFLEEKWFGGMHGGHVSIETDHEVTGFGPQGKFHIFGNKKKFHSHFSSQKILDRNHI